MKPIPQYRAARSGTRLSVNLDQAAHVRLAYCARFANEGLETIATGSTIVRRALELYQQHCESLIRDENGRQALEYCYEATQLRAANKGKQALGLTVEQVKSAPILKTIKELVGEGPQPASIADVLAYERRRWAKEAAAEAATAQDPHE